MPPLDTVDTSPEDNRTAVIAEILYLCNLLVAPGVAFGLLLILYMQRISRSNPLGRCHLRQTLRASLWAGILIILVNALIILIGGYDRPATWVLLIIYFTTIHATLVLLGVVGLARALAAQHYHYPLIGTHCDFETST